MEDNKMDQKGNKYEDIINLPHHTSKVHPRMDRRDRAAQFAPFAALTGYGEAILESSRFTEDLTELGEDRKAELDGVIREFLEFFQEKPLLKITYYREDLYKKGGGYQICEGYAKKVDRDQRYIWMENGEEIPIDMIYAMEIHHQQ